MCNHGNFVKDDMKIDDLILEGLELAKLKLEKPVEKNNNNAEEYEVNIRYNLLYLARHKPLQITNQCDSCSKYMCRVPEKIHTHSTLTLSLPCHP